MTQNFSTAYMAHDNHRNVSINSFASSVGMNKTIRPMNFKSPVKTSINFNTLNQQKNNRLISEVKIL